MPDYDAAEFRALIAANLLGRKVASYRALCLDLGLPERKHALLSKAARGLPISDDSARMIARALGIAPPPRNPVRLTVPKHLRSLVDAARQAGRSTEDILLRGLEGR